MSDSLVRKPALIAGIDEVGRGCLAGAVVTAIVVFEPGVHIEGLTDSKKLNAKRREHLAETIKQRALAWAIGRAEPSEIDRINILQASMLAMRRAYDSLGIKPDWVKVDGNHYPDIACPGEAIVGGDLSEAEISAASILAKVFRDEEMQTLDVLYPGYEFSVHKAYPTPRHKQAIQELGITPLHRCSYAPVRAIIQNHRGL